MAELKGHRYKLSGSTLIEAMTASIIIMSCFTIAMMIYLNVTRGVVNQKNLGAEAIAGAMALKMLDAEEGTHESEDNGMYRVKASLESFQQAKDLQLISIQVRDLHDNIILERKEIQYRQ